MSTECQVLGGSPNCRIGKTCPNKNCDYRICNYCAEKILKYNDNPFFDTFECPACIRPVVYRFNTSRNICRKISIF